VHWLTLGFISSCIEHFTYLGLFTILTLCGLGLPVPEDVALLLGGVLAREGIIRYPITLVVGLLGVIAGDDILYLVGRGIGARVISYAGNQSRATKHAARLHAFMHRHGHLTIFYARFFPGFRALVYLSAGSAKFSFAHFFFFDFAGAVISVPVVVTAGYLFADRLGNLINVIHTFNKLIWLTVGLGGLTLLTRHFVLEYWRRGVSS
jgi:membrane protein DedA with SNARE-associated domain